MVLLFSQSCHEDDGRKDSSSDSEQKITQQLLDQELLVHQERLIQLLDQGDNEIFMDHEAPILTADLSGTENNVVYIRVHSVHTYKAFCRFIGWDFIYQ